ncbi:MAG: hypothetical protein WC860_07660 [Candidatus Margulisiibacteriota bacterium]|jgi:hypothetical protein
MLKKLTYFTFALILLAIILSAPVFAAKYKKIEHFISSIYLNPPTSQTTIFGIQFDNYFTDNFFYTLAIKGAILGNGRGGYGTAGFGLGYNLWLNKNFAFNTYGLLGSGGGGGLKVGGGLNFEAQIGVNYLIIPNWQLELNLGYLTYLTGSFSTPTITFGISNLNFANIFVPEDAVPQKPTSNQQESLRLSFEIKNYYYQPQEIITLFGAKTKKFITRNWYWGEAGFGALGGKRNGYIEGGLHTGYLIGFAPFEIDFNLFLGAGGGGITALEGGGLIAQPTCNLGVNLLNWYLAVQVGYQSFLTGSVNSMTWGLNLSRNLEDFF